MNIRYPCLNIPSSGIISVCHRDLLFLFVFHVFFLVVELGVGGFHSVAQAGLKPNFFSLLYAGISHEPTILSVLGLISLAPWCGPVSDLQQSPASVSLSPGVTVPSFSVHQKLAFEALLVQDERDPLPLPLHLCSPQTVLL